LKKEGKPVTVPEDDKEMVIVCWKINFCVLAKFPAGEC